MYCEIYLVNVTNKIMKFRFFLRESACLHCTFPGATTEVRKKNTAHPAACTTRAMERTVRSF